MDDLISDGSLRASEEVLYELEIGDDDLYEWAKQRTEMFIPLSADIQQSVAGILASHGNLIDVDRSRSMADPFVIAVAQANGCCVVSGEKRTPSNARPKIPNVCDDLGLRHITFLDLIREQGWVFQR